MSFGWSLQRPRYSFLMSVATDARIRGYTLSHMPRLFPLWVLNSNNSVSPKKSSKSFEVDFDEEASNMPPKYDNQLSVHPETYGARYPGLITELFLGDDKEAIYSSPLPKIWINIGSPCTRPYGIWTWRGKLFFRISNCSMSVKSILSISDPIVFPRTARRNLLSSSSKQE